ncbi:MAG: hypothetical protein ACTSPK_13285 [Candidatus Heimdallarchaeota archaeon]
MKLNSKTIKLLLLFIFVSFIPIQVTQSALNVDALYSYSEDAPVVDGVLEDTLWKITREIDVTLYLLNDQSTIMGISIMSIYDETTEIIYFGITIPDVSFDNDIFAIAFKTNTTADLVVYDSGWGYGGGHDAKIIYCNDNDTADGITYANQLDGTTDTGAGGTNDIDGVGTYDGSQYVYEISMPLDSGDTNGADFSLARLDTIEFFVFYLEDGCSADYTQIRETDGDYDYCTLNVGRQGLLGPSTWFIVASLVSSLAVIAYVSRRRK